MLTRSDMGTGPACHVIGVRPDGSRCILESLPARQRRRAERLAGRFRAMLEGYASILVETEGRIEGKAERL